MNIASKIFSLLGVATAVVGMLMGVWANFVFHSSFYGNIGLALFITGTIFYALACIFYLSETD